MNEPGTGSLATGAGAPSFAAAPAAASSVVVDTTLLRVTGLRGRVVLVVPVVRVARGRPADGAVPFSALRRRRGRPVRWGR
ncbi:hypothetical protein SCA03_02980 [Streptomyces cacaoi]|uniref:Uncharacterized protein n=1 Tax=Streptomyces cacaoi TaxID=1898 RepID=A0A4Y3QST4_STRCI|nr:hypothetical protein SCA03_02980 [Streptomyces cacaoi]